MKIRAIYQTDFELRQRRNNKKQEAKKKAKNVKTEFSKILKYYLDK